MKILFIVPHVRPYDSQSVREKPTGGTERATTFLGEALMKFGHEVRWITTFADAMSFDTEWPEVVITHECPGLQNRMTQTERFPLADVTYLDHVRNSADLRQFFVSPAFPQKGLKLEGNIKVIFDGSLAATGDDNYRFDSRRDRFFDHVLNQGLVDQRQHLFR